MDDKAILNYPGSKKRLLDFIYKNTNSLLEKDKYILDIFAGTGCVAQMYRNQNYKVFANDVEKYATNISNTLLRNTYDINFDKLNTDYNFNKNKLMLLFKDQIETESTYIKSNNLDVISLYKNFNNIWKDNFSLTYNDIKLTTIKDLNEHISDIPFMLFTLYYTGSYFGLLQAIDIDSLRYAIEQSQEKDVLLTCLYYAMKECTFSKDGHMAQPLNPEKNTKKMFSVREKSICDIFFNKLREFDSESKSFIRADLPDGKAFNMSFDELISNSEIKKNVGFIYADPPYTDMQYSRYFHLLTTITNYTYPELTIKNGKLTTGLYADNRYQSKISSRSMALNELKKLIDFSSSNDIPLCFSYAYPVNIKEQATDRYTMNIEELISEMQSAFQHVDVIKENYSHCNNKNASQKHVYEYLIIGHQDKSTNETDERISTFKEEVKKIKATNHSPLYDNMLYWSQKPYNVTDLILDIFSKEGDIVFDPFMGSGVTIIEALNKKYNLKSIGVDINDFPIFLCQNSLNNVSKKEVECLNNLKQDIIKLKKYYYTDCPVCGNTKANIKKIIYDTEPSLIIKDVIYNCSCNSKDLHKSASSNDIKSFVENRKTKNITNIPLLENSRIAVKSNECIADKFSNRSLFILDQIKQLISQEKDQKSKDILKYLFASIIHKSKILDVKMSSQWPLWIPKKNCLERNVPDLLINSIDNYLASCNYIKDNYYTEHFINHFKELKNNYGLIIKNGVQCIDSSCIPDECVDLIITDPPYLGQVPYSEYMQLYQSFLDNSIDYSNEIVITNAKDRKKDYSDYLNLMDEAFKNISRMLKSNAYMFMYFHDSNLSVWNDLINILNKNQLSFITSVHISNPQKTLKKILDPKKTMNGDSLIIFKKDTNHNNIENISFANEHLNTVKDICNGIIGKQNAISTSELYDNGVLEFMINNKLLDNVSKEYKDLTEMFSTFLDWDEEIGKWKRSL